MDADQEPRATCCGCGERAAQPGALRWYAPSVVFGYLIGIPPKRDRHCDDCASGLNLLGLLAVIALMLTIFVAVVVWL